LKKILLPLILVSTLFAIPADVEIYSSPNGGCQQTIVNAIADADSAVDVAMYTFTEGEIAKALISAKERGVQVRVVVNGENVNGTYSKATFLANAGIPVKYETKSGLMHDKFAVIDGQGVITGSFNWTANAEASNCENLLVILSPTIALKYGAEFEEIWTMATTYASTGTTSSQSSSISSSSAPVPVQQQSNDYTVYITRTGSKYHSYGCSYLRSSCIPIARSKAIARGYGPCSRCNP